MKQHSKNKSIKIGENEELNSNAKIQNGIFIDGRLTGWGEVQYKGGDKYTGMFKDGKRSGYGSMKIF